MLTIAGEGGVEVFQWMEFKGTQRVGREDNWVTPNQTLYLKKKKKFFRDHIGPFWDTQKMFYMFGKIPHFLLDFLGNLS